MPTGLAMDGTAFDRQEGAPTPRLRRWIEARKRLGTLDLSETFFRIMREVEQGQWHLFQWADELGISDDEMLIELDRYLHQRRAA